MAKNPNPQGKGLIPVLDTLLINREQTNIPAKEVEQIICELFTSQFVLEGEFKFLPTIGRSYWLYRKNDSFRLSMIKPDEWQDDSFGQSIGECVMQSDMTWTLILSSRAKNDKEFIHYIELQWEKFKKDLVSKTSLKQLLPVYNGKLPFYQRVLASNLAYSLAVSIDKRIAQGGKMDIKLIESTDFSMFM